MTCSRLRCAAQHSAAPIAPQGLWAMLGRQELSPLAAFPLPSEKERHRELGHVRQGSTPLPKRPRQALQRLGSHPRRRSSAFCRLLGVVPVPAMPLPCSPRKTPQVAQGAFYVILPPVHSPRSGKETPLASEGRHCRVKDAKRCTSWKAPQTPGSRVLAFRQWGRLPAAGEILRLRNCPPAALPRLRWLYLGHPLRTPMPYPLKTLIKQGLTLLLWLSP